MFDPEAEGLSDYIIDFIINVSAVAGRARSMPSRGCGRPNELPGSVFKAEKNGVLFSQIV